MGEKKEFLVRFAKQYMQGHKDIEYFMFGHRHIELDLMLSKKTRLMILGDWIWQFTPFAPPFPPSRPQAIPAAADFLFGTFSFVRW